MGQKRVCLIVLGDFGHSPRMMYHALSLAKNGFVLDVIAYSGSKPGRLLNNPNINFHCIQDFAWLSQYPKFVSHIFKPFFQSLLLFFTLFYTLIKPDFIFVQNPPSVPTLPVVWFYCLIRSVKFIIDWHNYGHTLLSLTLGSNHLLVKIYRWCESYFGSKSYHNFCVSQAMKTDLERRWNIRATVLYDNPSDAFHPIDVQEKHLLFAKLAQKYPQFKGDDKGFTKFTKLAKRGIAVERKDRPAIVMSSTSWTEDEDFDLLLRALEEYDHLKPEVSKHLPHILCLITGKGPMKEFYSNLIASKSWSKVEFMLAWLEIEDYPRMIACSDVGVSLHKSSSNLDLPMKIVDMFGSCLPVIAYDYNCLHELVNFGQNGVTFETSEQLSHFLVSLLQNFPKTTLLSKMRQNLINNRDKMHWDNTWNRVAKPVFDSSALSSPSKL